MNKEDIINWADGALDRLGLRVVSIEDHNTHHRKIICNDIGPNTPELCMLMNEVKFTADESVCLPPHNDECLCVVVVDEDFK